MNRRAAWPCGVLILAATLSACATLEREDVAAPAGGGSVTMRTNTALVVNLAPDTGSGSAAWVLRSASPNLVPVGGPDFTPSPKPRGLTGVADTTTFRFRATGTGTGALEFAWVAPAGQPPVPERVVRYDVAIGPSMGLATDWFGTVGLQSVREAGNSTMAPAAPQGGASAPAVVK